MAKSGATEINRQTPFKQVIQVIICVTYSRLIGYLFATTTAIAPPLCRLLFRQSLVVVEPTQ